MNIFDKSPIQRVLEELGASTEEESTWWADAVAQGLQEAALELRDETIDTSAQPASQRTH